MSDIFISYAREDRPRAETLARALEAQGWSVWWDRTIPAGKTFDNVIEAALASTRCVIVLWSQISVDSRWVRSEAEEGAAREVLVPVVIERDVRIPLAFKRIQAADLANWDGRAETTAFQTLVADIAQLLGPPPRRQAVERQLEAAAQRGADEEDRKRRQAEFVPPPVKSGAAAKPSTVPKPVVWVAGMVGAVVMILLLNRVGRDNNSALPENRPMMAERPTATLTAAPAAIHLGESATLSWRTTATNQVRLEPGIGAVHTGGSLQVSPQRDVTYRLVASGPGGTVEDTVRVAVRPRAPSLPTAELSAEPRRIHALEPVTLRWSTTNAPTVRVDPFVGPVAPNGSQQVWPMTNIRYRLTAKGPGGMVEDTVSITVIAPPPHTQVRGTVRDTAGAPLVNARMRIEGTSLTATTEAQGHYVFDDVPPGTYTVVADAIGYVRRRIASVSVLASKTTTLDVTLCRVRSGVVPDIFGKASPSKQCRP
jgi:hypothetical protein